MIVPLTTFEALFAGVNGTNVATSYGLEYFLIPHNPYISYQTAKVELRYPTQFLLPWRWLAIKVKTQKTARLSEIFGIVISEWST